MMEEGARGVPRIGQGRRLAWADGWRFNEIEY